MYTWQYNLLFNSLYPSFAVVRCLRRKKRDDTKPDNLWPLQYNKKTKPTHHFYYFRIFKTVWYKHNFFFWKKMEKEFHKQILWICPTFFSERIPAWHLLSWRLRWTMFLKSEAHQVSNFGLAKQVWSLNHIICQRDTLIELETGPVRNLIK